MYSKARQNLSEVLKPLNSAPLQVFLTDTVQQGDLVERVIEEIGGSISIMQTSFSIAEEYLRRIFLLKDKHDIRHLSIILDFKATKKTMMIWHFLNQVANEVHLCNNHSKVILITNDRDCVSIITSQNLTRGNRYESTLVTTDKSVYNQLASQMQMMIETQSVSLNSLIDDSITPDSSQEDNGR